jgi:hypothetical protein
VIVTAPAEVKITPADLRKEACDRCSAQAYVAVVKGQAMLLFCAHHFAQHEHALIAGGWKVTDDRERLQEKRQYDQG